jgi:hypothetical protein
MTELPRGVAIAHIWTPASEPLTPAELADFLSERGFVPGVADEAGTVHAATGLAEARFVVSGGAWSFLSLSSSKGNGCTIQVLPPEEMPMPDDYLLKRAVRRPRLVYRVIAGGPSNSDRNLCENLAEALLVAQNGAVQIAGRGTKGNKPISYTNPWIGEIKH